MSPLPLPTKIVALFAAAAVLLSVSDASVLSLDKNTFAQETAGKIVFIKFFAPWCGHCKSMALDWEKLAAEYSDNKDVLIAEVDCTTDDGESLCAEVDVNGFPTLKYGDPLALEEYDGGRDYDSLKSFSMEHLKPSCSPQNLDICDEVKLAAILKFQQMSTEVLQQELDAYNKEMENIDQWFEEEENKLQDAYEKLHEDANAKKYDLKETKMANLMKAVLHTKEQQSAKTEL